MICRLADIRLKNPFFQHYNWSVFCANEAYEQKGILSNLHLMLLRILFYIIILFCLATNENAPKQQNVYVRFCTTKSEREADKQIDWQKKAKAMPMIWFFIIHHWTGEKINILYVCTVVLVGKPNLVLINDIIPNIHTHTLSVRLFSSWIHHIWHCIDYKFSIKWNYPVFDDAAVRASHHSYKLQQ